MQIKSVIYLRQEGLSVFRSLSEGFFVCLFLPKRFLLQLELFNAVVRYFFLHLSEAKAKAQRSQHLSSSVKGHTKIQLCRNLLISTFFPTLVPDVDVSFMIRNVNNVYNE